MSKVAKPKPNGKQKSKTPKPTTSTANEDATTEHHAPEPAVNDDIYKKTLAEAKAILARYETDWSRLAELADQVDTVYGERRLAKWAAEAGISACTAKRQRSTLPAYTSIGAPAPRLYSVAQALQAHPDRVEILKENPKLTKVEALKAMRVYRKRQKAKSDWRRDECKQSIEALHKLSKRYYTRP